MGLPVMEEAGSYPARDPHLNLPALMSCISLCHCGIISAFIAFLPFEYKKCASPSFLPFVHLVTLRTEESVGLSLRGWWHTL